MKRMNLTATLSVSLNFELADKGRRHTAMLPLAWISMELSRWQRLISQVKTGLTLAQIGFNAIAWGLA